LIENEIELKLCKEIRSRRKEAGLTLSGLAKRSGLPLEMLEELERGKIPEEMIVDDAAALADVFQCKIWELFD